MLLVVICGESTVNNLLCTLTDISNNNWINTTKTADYRQILLCSDIQCQCSYFNPYVEGFLRRSFHFLTSNTLT